MTRGRKNVEDVLVTALPAPAPDNELLMRRRYTASFALFSAISPVSDGNHDVASLEALLGLAKMTVRPGDQFLVSIERMTGRPEGDADE